MGARGRLTREWFRDWFGEEYLALYPHRDAREAADAVRLYLSAVPPLPDLPVLDLACGAGRHLRELDDAGVRAVGLDLSPVLLRRAQQQRRDPLVCGDMRTLPFGWRAFGGLTTFFTSFGYFDTADEDSAVAREMHRVLEPGGSFLLDFLNADRVRRDLVAQDSQTIEAGRVIQTRTIEGDVVVKRIRLEPADGGRSRFYIERVRLYEPDELEGLLGSCGLAVSHRFGDYEGQPLRTTSPRLILAGRAA